MTPEEFELAVPSAQLSERDMNICRALFIDKKLAADIAVLYGLTEARVSQIATKFKRCLPAPELPAGWREITVPLPVGIAGAIEELSLQLLKQTDGDNKRDS